MTRNEYSQSFSSIDVKKSFGCTFFVKAGKKGQNLPTVSWDEDWGCRQASTKAGTGGGGRWNSGGGGGNEGQPEKKIRILLTKQKFIWSEMFREISMKALQ